VSDSTPSVTPGAASPVAAPTPAPRIGRLVPALVVAALVIAAAGGLYAANLRWGTHAMVVTAFAGAEALVKGDGAALSALSAEPMRSELTPDAMDKMKRAALKVEFYNVKWKGENVSVAARTGLGPGILLVGPSPDAPDQAVFRTLGALGDTIGVISLKRTWSGWAITAMTAGLATETSGSVPPASRPRSPTDSAPETATP